MAATPDDARLSDPRLGKAFRLEGRMLGGTLGTAIMLSLLFSILPTNISGSLTDEHTTWHALDAALNPKVAGDPANAAIMDKLWTPITDKIKDQVDEKLADATEQVKDGVETAVRAKVTEAVSKKAAKGTGKIADGINALGTGLDKLALGTDAFVDGVGKIVALRQEGQSWRFSFQAPSELMRYIAQKGSICVEGISLTVNEVEGDVFGVNLIPHTFEHTTLGRMTTGQSVNLEIDALARYVERIRTAN